MFRIILVVAAGVIFGAWKGFETMTNARNAWGDWLFKGKKPSDKDEGWKP